MQHGSESLGAVKVLKRESRHLAHELAERLQPLLPQHDQQGPRDALPKLSSPLRANRRSRDMQGAS